MLPAIPEPTSVDLERAHVLAQSVVEWAGTCEDVAELDDARARVAAIGTYLRRRDTQAAKALATAERRLEVRIGELIGEAEPIAGPGRGKPSSVDDGLTRNQRHQTRKIAQHKDLPEVQDAIEGGESKAEVLRRIKAAERAKAEQELDDDIAEWAATIPEPTDPEGDKHRAEVWRGLMAAVDGSRALAKFTPAEINDAIDSHPFEHVREQMAADLIEAVTTTARYTEVATRWT